VLELRDGIRKSDKGVNYSTDLHKPNNKLVNALLEHFWCMDEFRNGIRKSDRRVNYSHRLARTKQQVSYYIVGAFLVHG